MTTTNMLNVNTDYYYNIDDSSNDMDYYNQYGLKNTHTEKLKILKITKCFITIKLYDGVNGITQIKRKIFYDEYEKDNYIKFDEFKKFYLNQFLTIDEFNKLQQEHQEKYIKNDINDYKTLKEISKEIKEKEERKKYKKECKDLLNLKYINDYLNELRMNIDEEDKEKLKDELDEWILEKLKNGL